MPLADRKALKGNLPERQGSDHRPGIAISAVRVGARFVRDLAISGELKKNFIGRSSFSP